jgi:hypothetical protein
MSAVHQILDPAKPISHVFSKCALAVMTKAPQAGQVKTRLQPSLTAEEAAQLNVCFLRDTAAAIKSVTRNDAVGIGVYTPVGSETIYKDILPTDFFLLPQRGDGFGERLVFAIEDLLRCGLGSVCLIDSDSPTVPAEIYAQAVQILAMPGERVVLGPSDDGGYYLIGMKRNQPELFEGVDWSTARVLEQTKDRAHELQLDISLLPNSYDVDDAATLRRMSEELLSGESSPAIAPNTRRFLAELVRQKEL